MKTACPNCGADIEFRYDDSFVRVCGNCRNAVVRTDRGVDSLGKVADLVPLDSPLRLFADGQLGSQTFILVGMAQLRHASGGTTQEWYAKFSDTWGWLAEAQGRYYMTFEVEGAQLPRLEELVPGQVVNLPTMLGATRPFTVAEVGSATYMAANGELPFRLVPNGSYRFVDLSDGQGNFATIDYGEPGDPPTLYTGQQLGLADLHITGGEVGPPRDASISSTRLACPNCNGPIDIHSPDTLRAACAYCSHLLDVQAGALRIIGQVRKASPRIPLGTKATFSEGEMTVIGFVERSAQVEGDWYPFEEYLLYEPAIGFRWLVNSDGHWSYVQPVAVGAVTFEGTQARYDDVKFKLFQGAQLRVDTVVGEFYWQVQAGEEVWGEDFIAPPAMLSRETSGSEENWSLSTYLKPKQVTAALGEREAAPEGAKPEFQFGGGTGVAPNQPDPAGAAAVPLTLAFLALIVLGIIFAAIAPASEKYTNVVNIPSGTFTPPPATEPASDVNPPNVFFSEPFELEAGKNVELGFRASLTNNWAFVVASLVNAASGDVVTVNASMEYYSGYDDGESWSEGKDYDTEVVGPVKAGQYVLRLETQQGASVAEVPLTVRVRQGVFRGKYLWWSIFVLGIPFFILGIFSYSHERRRWSNSTQGTSSMPKTPLVIVVGSVVLLLTGIVVILKAIASSSSDD
jgi:hypothetical protein